MDTVKQRLAKWAKERHGSLKEVARMADLNYSHLTQIDDEKLPSGRITQPLARLGLNINWLLTGEGEMDVPRPDRLRTPIVTINIDTGEVLTPEQAAEHFRKKAEDQRDERDSIDGEKEKTT